MTSPRVAILPYGQALGVTPARLPLASLGWPLGVPAGIEGGVLGDLDRDDHLIVPPRNTLHLRPGFGTRARVSLLFREPRAIHGHHMRLLQLFSHRRFFRVLTGDPGLIAALPNAVEFPMGGTWVPHWRDVSCEKRAMCSLIASAKRSQPGHRLRHAVVDWVREARTDVEVMGMGYRPFSEKAEGLAPYRYSVVIENVREPGYFSEKLVDALLCGTVPIYWGAPDIGRFFDIGAMVVCDGLEDVQRAVVAMSEADFAARAEALARARAVAAGYADIEGRAARAVLAAAQGAGGQRP
ncbi:MAG TPA: hypothetical protein DCX34_04820 [Roseovarius sp.]|nr:hypothetical protein [Roseovarius sp.]